MRQMSEPEALIRELSFALLRRADPRADTPEGEECRDLLQHALGWIERARTVQKLRVIRGGKP